MQECCRYLGPRESVGDNVVVVVGDGGGGGAGAGGGGGSCGGGGGSGGRSSSSSIPNQLPAHCTKNFEGRVLQRPGGGRVFSYRKRKNCVGNGIFVAPDGVSPHHVTSSIVRRNAGGSRLIFIWPQKVRTGSRLSSILVPLVHGVLLYASCVLESLISHLSCGAMELTFISCTLFFLFLLKILPWLYEGYVYRKTINKIPGPQGHPFLGVAMILGNLPKEERIKQYTKWSFAHKDGFYRTWIGTEAIVHIRKPKHVEMLLTSNTNITKSSIYRYAEDWLGKGLVTSTGAKWFKDRKLITPTFHFNILEQFAIVMNEKMQIFLKCIESELTKAPGKPIDIFPLSLRFGMDTICETAMGINIRAQESISHEYCLHVQKFTELLNHRFLRPWQRCNWLFKLTSAGKEYYSTVEAMHNFIKHVIEKKKTARNLQRENRENEDTEEVLGIQKRKAFLELLLDENRKHVYPMSDTELREQVDTFMFAGHDTTSAAISWALLCLATELDVQEKVHEELQEVFGESHVAATTNNIAKLKYLDRVLKEALRLYPSAPIFSRCLTEEMNIDGYVIPKGTTVTINSYCCHRDPENWLNPEEFDPDRFLPENAKHRHTFAYVPFSAGPRNCIGQKYAQLEEKIALTGILRRWRVKSAKPRDQVTFYNNLVLRPSDGIYLYFIPK